MTRQELHDSKVELLDMIHELATEPVADLEAAKAKVDEFFERLEAESGEKRQTT
jgi:hypothetical protein